MSIESCDSKERKVNNTLHWENIRAINFPSSLLMTVKLRGHHFVVTQITCYILLYWQHQDSLIFKYMSSYLPKQIKFHWNQSVLPRDTLTVQNILK